MQKITPFLWFNNQAEEAMNFYCSIFPNSKAEAVQQYGEGVPTPSGDITSVSFEIEGQHFVAFNGGPDFPFTPAISLFVNCESQAEVDDLWGKLSEGGSEQQCGWLQDKFGVSWQIAPTILQELLQDPDKTKAQNVLQAMFQMKKIDIQKLKEAYAA